LSVATDDGRSVTSDGPTRYYDYFITSNVGVLTYFGARDTVPASTHCTASTGMGRGPIGCHISFFLLHDLRCHWCTL